MGYELLASQKNNSGILLDPRTKLAVLITIAVFILGGFLSFYNDFPHSDLLHAARSAGEYHRKAGSCPDGDDFRYSVRSV